MKHCVFLQLISPWLRFLESHYSVVCHRLSDGCDISLSMKMDIHCDLEVRCIMSVLFLTGEMGDNRHVYGSSSSLSRSWSISFCKCVSYVFPSILTAFPCFKTRMYGTIWVERLLKKWYTSYKTVLPLRLEYSRKTMSLQRLNIWDIRIHYLPWRKYQLDLSSQCLEHGSLC